MCARLRTSSDPLTSQLLMQFKAQSDTQRDVPDIHISSLTAKASLVTGDSVYLTISSSFTLLIMLCLTRPAPSTLPLCHSKNHRL